jgi:hypothetical protein
MTTDLDVGRVAGGGGVELKELMTDIAQHPERKLEATKYLLVCIRSCKKEWSHLVLTITVRVHHLYNGIHDFVRC